MAEWKEIDLDAAVWRIPSSRMKMAREHVVPLSTQAVAILKEASALTAGKRFVFPSVRTPLRPMSENTLNAALRRLGYGQDEMTSHGFRSTASTLLNESGKWSPDAIERALAHGDSDTVRAAYHRGAHWAERVTIAPCDYLDQLREGGKVVAPPLRHGGATTSTSCVRAARSCPWFVPTVPNRRRRNRLTRERLPQENNTRTNVEIGVSTRETAPPAGWASMAGVLVEGPKVADYAARCQD
eukprot:gene4854-6610_t